MQSQGTINPPRELRADELAVLRRLLSEDFPGAAELRKQVPHTRVREECTCGCPSVWFVVDTALAPQAETDNGVAVEAFAPLPDGNQSTWVMLHVWEEFLDGLELVPPGTDSSFPLPVVGSIEMSVWS